MSPTSRQRRLLEADMSRRQFLKVTGQAAAGAAMPGSAIKGLMGGAPAAATSFVLPKTTDEAYLALIKWAKDTGKYQDWYNKCVAYYSDPRYQNYYGRPDENPDKPKTKEDIDKLSKQRISDWAVWNAAPAYEGDQNDALDALNWVLWDGRHYQADDILPQWITQYRLNTWVGKDVGPEHPFIKDREKWDKAINGLSTGKASKEVKTEFANILKGMLDPQRFKKAMKDLGTRWARVEKNYNPYDDESEPIPDEAEELAPEETKPAEQEVQASDEPDSWRTQSVEFESRLRRLVR